MASLFDLPKVKGKDNLILKKVKGKRKTLKAGGGIIDQVKAIVDTVSKELGQFTDAYEVVREKAQLSGYIDKAVENNVIAIDTETTGLNPILDKIVGLCLYTPNQKAVYIPINHVNYITNGKIPEQLESEFIANELNRLIKEKVKIIMFNAVFDVRVLKNQIGVELTPYWDCYLAARLLNENEPENNLKYLHTKYCSSNDEKNHYSYDRLFSGLSFDKIPISTAYLYAARDAIITYELYKFQEPYLTTESEKCINQDLQGPANVFRNIEMPLVNVIAQMEDTGINFDKKFAKELSEKYSKRLKEKEDEFYLECSKIENDINDYKTKNPGKLDTLININSPTQIAILLYDILGIETVNKEKARGTGEDILLKIKHPIVNIILEYREIAKLLSTYIDKMVDIVNPKTNRIHCKFNQIGADTGRLSSSDPNMQNIPSKNKEIRKMFVATDGYVLLSSDYSAQEPRLTAHMSNDIKMIEAYKQGKDLYVEIASIANNLPYDECKEFRADGSKNPEGKKRRNQAKAIVLGVCYGKGVPAIATDLNVNVKKAQEIYDKIMREFPGLKQFMIDSENMAREKGYVTTVWGRKRRLPNMQLPEYEFTYDKSSSVAFDPLAFDDVELEKEVPENIVLMYIKKLRTCRTRFEKQSIKNQAKDKGIIIKDNGGYIAEARRQCVNSRIQGSAADQTKLAMILIGNDKQLKDLGFRLLLQVHDELIGECPEENAKEVSERFSALMVEAANDLKVPSKCDVEISKRWYGTTLQID